MYSLFCIFIIIIIIIMVGISFVVLLNCLYLNPRVLLFSILPPIPLRGEGASEQLCGPSCQLPG